MSGIGHIKNPVSGFWEYLRAIREDKRSYIERHQPTILVRLGIEPNNWIKMTKEFESTFKDVVGNPSLMDTAMAILNRKRRPAISNCKALLS
jgi:hypothetical protein